MLTWKDTSRKNQAGEIISPSRSADLSGFGQVSIHTHIHYPGQLLVDCHRLDIQMHVLKSTDMNTAISETEQLLRARLAQKIAICQDALAVLT